jgi:hypothetical protein
MEISNLLQTNDFVQRNNAKLAVSKWEKTGLLEGLKGETEKAGMAQLLENQARQLVKEASSTGVAAGSEEWAGVALPLVRRIFAEFAAKEFVSVQPMNLPSGLIFYLDFKYGTAQPGFDNDNSIVQVIHLVLLTLMTLCLVLQLHQVIHQVVFMVQVVLVIQLTKYASSLLTAATGSNQGSGYKLI